MINTDISLSAKVASLSPEAMGLFCLLIPHLNAHGKMLADPHGIKGVVCPLVPWLDVSKIKQCLAEISEKTNLKWWRDDRGLYYLHSLNWHEHQKLRQDRLGPDRLPEYPGKDDDMPPSSEPLRDRSGSSPGQLPPEVEVEEKEEEGKKPSPDALRLSGLLADRIAGNNPANKNIKSNAREKSIERWAVDIDRMIRIDHRDLVEIEAILDWCQVDDFWSCNILSGATLRKQYDKLLMQMNRANGNNNLGGSVGPLAASGRRVY
jgi:hypothetical protein